MHIWPLRPLHTSTNPLSMDLVANGGASWNMLHGAKFGLTIIVFSSTTRWHRGQPPLLRAHHHQPPNSTSNATSAQRSSRSHSTETGTSTQDRAEAARDTPRAIPRTRARDRAKGRTLKYNAHWCCLVLVRCCHHLCHCRP